MKFAWAVLFLLPPAAGGQDVRGLAEKQEIQISGHAGWSGRVARGDWTPVSLDVDNRGSDREVLLAVCWAFPGSSQGEANPTLGSLYSRTGPVHHLPLLLPAKSRKRISLSLLAPDQDKLSVWAFAIEPRKGKTLARGEMITRPLDPRKRLVAFVGQARPEGLAGADIESAWVQPDELPEEWQGYGGLDALVWLDGKATEIRSASQVEALKLWISGGGRFFVARSSTVDFAGTPIAELLPVRLGTSREMPGLEGLDIPQGNTVVLETKQRAGHLRGGTSDLPLIVEADRDLGSVTFLAFDPTRPPMTGWAPQASRFWLWLFRFSPQPPAPASTEERRTSPRVIGSHSLAQQAGRFPDVAAPEIGGLFLLIILYLIVVGPLDYLLLKWLRRLELTWFTFPGYVFLFTLFILLVGGAFIQRAANQREIAVVDHFPASGFTRTRALSAVLAPGDVLYRCNDAEPVSSNFISRALYMDTSGELTNVRMIHGTPRLAENWLLNRGYTGLALTDRCRTSPSPLQFRVQFVSESEVSVSLKNNSGTDYESAVLATRDGVFWLSEIRTGESKVTGHREHKSPKAYVQSDGLPLGQAAQPEYGGYEERSYGVLSEQQLNPIVRKILITLCFPPAPANDSEVLTGLARGLDASRWVDSGGALLLAWPRQKETHIQFEPSPSKTTSVVLHRFFQRATP